MAIELSGVRTGLQQDQQDAVKKARRILNISPSDVLRADIVKTSLDARRRGNVVFVSTVRFELRDSDQEKEIAQNTNAVLYRPVELKPRFGKKKWNGRIIIAGFGPAGMMAAHLLARFGYRPLVLERGACMSKRVKEVEHFWKTGSLNAQTNVQFGEGGAGTFSDGKLTTRIHDPLCQYVMQLFLRHGAPETMMRQAKPHIGTDRLRKVVCSIRSEMQQWGAEILFDNCLIDLQIKNGSLRRVSTSQNQTMETPALILAVGHSARDTFFMLQRNGLAIQPKPFSVGMRIEHLQQDVNRGLYGDLANHPMLPQGEYTLSQRVNRRGVYTFCMCPGGVVVPAASEHGGVVTNGMSEYARDGRNANSALVVEVTPNDFGLKPLDGIEFQRKIERAAFAAGGNTYAAPYSTVGAYLKRSRKLFSSRLQPTYARGVVAANLHDLFPDTVNRMLEIGLETFGKRLPGFDADQALLTAPETRTSSPVRILRTQDGLSSVKGIYPCGEGAGYAGGIMSAAVDGLKMALKVMEEFAPADC